MTITPRSTIAAALLATTSLATLSSVALAQTDIVLDEILVEASTGAKLPTPVAEIPQSVSVISREELDKIPTVKADEALRTTAGVNTTLYGTDADTDWFSIRGFQADQTGVFLDGMSLYQIGFGTFLMDPFMLESIEVLKGPSSGLYGGATVGGIVNYVGKRPTGESLRYTETGINSHGNAYLGFDVGDATESGDLAYRLTGKVSGGGWQTDDAQDLRGNILGSVTWTPDDNTSLTVYGHYQKVDLDHTSTGFLPYEGTVVDGPGGVPIPRDLNYGEPDFDVYERDQLMIGYELEHSLDEDWTVRQNARWAGVHVVEDSIYPTGTYNAEDELERQRWAHDTEAWIGTVDTNIEGRFDTGPISHTLLLGLDYKTYRHEASTFYEGAEGTIPWWDPLAPPYTTPALDPLNPVYGTLAYTPPALAPGSVTMLQQTGIYAQDQMKWDNWILTLNGRYDFARTEIDAIADSGDIEREEGVFTGRVGIGYQFDNGLTPYASYTTSFLPQLATTWDGELLASETGEQWEVGVKYEPTFMDGIITASVFNINRNNVAAPDPDAPPGEFGSAPIGEVNVLGAELEALVRYENFGFRGALTWLDAEIIANGSDTSLVGKTPVQVPTLTVALGVEYHFHDALDGFTVGAGMRYLGESWADSDNTLEVPATTLFDASLRYDKDDWGVALNVSNIFDTEYVQSCLSPTSCGYGAGRQVTLSLHKTW